MSDGHEWSRGKRRPKAPRVAGHDATVTPVPADGAAPLNDPTTGRWTDPAAAARRRWLLARARAVCVATLDPEHVPTWLAPNVRESAQYAAELAVRFPDPILARLVVDVAAAHCVYHGLLRLAAEGDVEALKEARSWAREHRSAYATLSGLAGSTKSTKTPEQAQADLERRLLGGRS